MRKNMGAKPLTYPQPVFILAAYGDDMTPCAMNAAWGGISDDTEISLCISAGHKTTKNILARKAFTVSMADAAHVAECDYVGLVSGNSVPDKFSKAGFHAVKSDFVDALVGEIVNVSVDEKVLDESGKVCTAKVRPITFDPFNNEYVVLGEVIGKAFHDGKKIK